MPDQGIEKMMRQLFAAMALTWGAFRTTAGAQTATRHHTTDTTPAVEIQNNQKVPVTVDLEYGAFDHRVGMVPPMQTESLPLPGWVPSVGAVQLFIHPAGGWDLETQSLMIRPGETLALVVPATGPVPDPTETMTEQLTPAELLQTTLTVDNPRSQAVIVFAGQGMFDVRLGQVPAHARETLKIPAAALNSGPSIRILVHPEGGWDLASETMVIRRGAHLGLRVPLHP